MPIDYVFDKPVNEQQLYDILKRAAIATESDLHLHLGIHYDFWYKKDPNDIEKKWGKGIAQFNRATNIISLDLERDLDSEEGEKEPLFTGVKASRFELQEQEHLCNYVESVVQAIKDVYESND